MYIYKITNKINNKVYIGQTTKSINLRWQRHCADALKNRLDTKFARAIRKYGKDNFVVEEIDTAQSKEELNQKEIYWINYYNSILEGYNSVDGGGDSNTYKYKTEEEMREIKEKIRQTKMKELNPHARAVKCKNIHTQKELFFNTVIECQEYFNEKNHNFVTRRCLHKTKCLYKKEWLISYQDEDYIENYTVEKGNRKSKRILVEDLKTNKKQEFESYASAERYFNLPLKTFSRKASKLKRKDFIVKNEYHIIVLD